MITEQLDRFVRAYRKGEAIFEEDTQGKEMYVVYSGTVELYKGHEGKRALVGKVNHGEYFGEMALVDASVLPHLVLDR